MQAMYEDRETAVRCAVGVPVKDWLMVEVGLRQLSALSSMLFATKMNKCPAGVTMMFADYTVVCSGSREWVVESLEKRGITVCRSKTKNMSLHEREKVSH